MQTQKHQSHAQFGEDLEILQYFGPQFRGTFVEVGAYMPDALSQTYLLEQNGWTGILVEPQPERCATLREQRRAAVYQCAAGSPDQAGSELTLQVDGALSRIVEAGPSSIGSKALISVKVRTLNSLLEESRISHVHFLSIDTEGFELNVLRGFDIKKFSPELIIIEDDGSSAANYRHMVQNGYRLVKRTGCNDWYVPRSRSFPTTVREILRLRARTIRTMIRELF